MDFKIHTGLSSFDVYMQYNFSMIFSNFYILSIYNYNIHYNRLILYIMHNVPLGSN